MKKIYEIDKFKLLVPKIMLVLFSKDNIIAIIDRKGKEIHYIIEIKNGKLCIENGWNINYSFNENILELYYNFINND